MLSVVLPFFLMQIFVCVTGTKALSNVTQQFSKLNKLGASFKNVRSKDAKFTIGFGAKRDSSSDSEEECENSIFEPNESGTVHDVRGSSSSIIEEGVELTESTVLPSKKSEDSFLPSVGIVMGSQSESESVQGIVFVRFPIVLMRFS